MIEKTNAAAIQLMLAQIRSYEARAKNQPLAVETEVVSGQQSFGDMVKGAVRSVSDMQKNAQKMSDAYDRGEDLPLTDVVLSMQKASIAFEATLQIRNKVIKAYEDIKNMPV
jgi:flagellar hook-basal body complex protein FliE